MNKICVTGRVTKDPVVRTANTKNGSRKVVAISLANNEGYGDNQVTNYFDMTVWDKQAEVMEKFVQKGTQLAVTGGIKLNKREYQGKEYVSMEITFPQIEFLGGTKGNEASKVAPNYDKQSAQPDTFVAETEEELPF